MKKNTALLIAGIVFAFVAFMHLLRLFFRSEIILSGNIIPMWVSWLGFFVAAILCFLMFDSRRRLI